MVHSGFPSLIWVSIFKQPNSSGIEKFEVQDQLIECLPHKSDGRQMWTFRNIKERRANILYELRRNRSIRNESARSDLPLLKHQKTTEPRKFHQKGNLALCYRGLSQMLS